MSVYAGYPGAPRSSYPPNPQIANPGGAYLQQATTATNPYPPLQGVKFLF